MKLHNGDCLEVMRLMPDNSVDSIVTDPPYGISFMGKKWDYQIPSVEVWKECLRVLKPGGHALIACGTRTQHRMAVNIEDAGFEIRDVVTWLYGSGFPKSMDVSKAIDKAAGAEREVVRREKRPVLPKGRGNGRDEEGRPIEIGLLGASESHEMNITAPATDAAKKWQGWGTALKPACEFWTLARKPLEKGLTVAQNVQKWGTGAVNVDGCRISTEGQDIGDVARFKGQDKKASEGWARPHKADDQAMLVKQQAAFAKMDSLGRWPANLILDEEAAAALDEQSGSLKSGAPGVKRAGNNGAAYGEESRPPGTQMSGFGDTGGASRFFYVAKASKSERNAGLEGMPIKEVWENGSGTNDIMTRKRVNPKTGELEDRNDVTRSANHHPTVKPIKLMSYLCRMITPPGGSVLDPFMGSGSTGVAAIKEAFEFTGIELSEEYLKICEARIKAAASGL